MEINLLSNNKEDYMTYTDTDNYSFTPIYEKSGFDILFPHLITKENIRKYVFISMHILLADNLFIHLYPFIFKKISIFAQIWIEACLVVLTWREVRNQNYTKKLKIKILIYCFSILFISFVFIFIWTFIVPYTQLFDIKASVKDDIYQTQYPILIFTSYSVINLMIPLIMIFNFLNLIKIASKKEKNANLNDKQPNEALELASNIYIYNQ
jgi:hypothetical protein